MSNSGRELGGRYRDDPIGSEGKSSAQRKSARDGPSWTPTESRLRDKLMKQFCKNAEGSSGNSEAYRSAECWCPGCGRLRDDETLPHCTKCSIRRMRDAEMEYSENSKWRSW